MFPEKPILGRAHPEIVERKNSFVKITEGDSQARSSLRKFGDSEVFIINFPGSRGLTIQN